MEEGEEQKGAAQIVSATTARGMAISWCSECSHQLDDYFDGYYEQVLNHLEWWIGAERTGDRSEAPTLEEMRCPECGRRLAWGGRYISIGDSGFWLVRAGEGRQQ